MNIIGQNGNDGEHYATEGYLEPEISSPPKPYNYSEEITEISQIIGRDLQPDEIQKLMSSKSTQALNRNDDLTIKY